MHLDHALLDRRLGRGVLFTPTLAPATLAGLTVIGLLLGLVIGWSRQIYAGLYPLMIGFNAIPKVAVVPILVLWFGIGFIPAVLTAFLISFFPITVNIATGLATLEPELEDVLRVLGAKRWDVLTKVGLPRSIGVGKGTVLLEDFDRTDCILIFGQNPGTNSPRMMTSLRDAARRGATILSFNPFRERALQRFQAPQSPIEMATLTSTRISSRLHQVRVGGDMAVVKGLMKAMVAADSLAQAERRAEVLDWGFIHGHTIGIDALSESILANPHLAWISIVLVTTWQAVPQAMLIYIAALVTIPGDVYEASSLDGATPFQQLTRITVPMISGYVLVNVILGFKNFLSTYDIIVGLTGGGPGTATRSVAMQIFSGFENGDYAYQMANSTIFFLITLVIALFQLRVSRGRTQF